MNPITKITIQHCLNGVIVGAGCQTLVFSLSEQKILLELLGDWICRPEATTDWVTTMYAERLKILSGGGPIQAERPLTESEVAGIPNPAEQQERRQRPENTLPPAALRYPDDPHQNFQAAVQELSRMGQQPTTAPTPQENQARESERR